MRVIAGTARGRRLDVPKGLDIRPTSDRAREAVFNRLHSHDLIDGAVVLDLFAGSGALGIEALSRGAAAATLVDHEPRAVNAIKGNLERLGLRGATVIRSSADAFLATVRSTYDVAFLDPPYAFDDWDALLAKVPADIVVVESDRVIDAGPAWREIKTSSYGVATIAVLERDDGYLRPHDERHEAP